MFTQNLGVMLYVDDVTAEKAFWLAAGFVITAESEMMGGETFDMKSHAASTMTITVYAKDVIAQVSPEVLDNVPSILFETDDIETLQAKIAELTDTCSPVNDQPFPNFNFSSPSGIYFAVRGQ